MREVYLVNNGGCYSDYRPICVFDRREDADEYAAARGGDVETFKLFEADETPARAMLHTVSMRIDKDEPRVYSREVWEDEYEYKDVLGRPTVSGYRFRGGPIEWEITAKGGNLAACKKAVFDRVAASRLAFAEWNLDWRNVEMIPSNIRIEWYEDGEIQKNKNFFRDDS